MSLIIINSNVETINDQCATKDITDLIRQHMGDDMADYIEQTLIKYDEKIEELSDEAKERDNLEQTLYDISNMIEKVKDNISDFEDVDQPEFDYLVEMINDIYEMAS